MLLALIWVLLYPFLLYLIARTSRVLRYPTIVLNVVMIVMLLISAFRVGTYEFQPIGSGSSLSDSPTELQLDVSRYESPPDITTLCWTDTPMLVLWLTCTISTTTTS